MVRYCHNCGNEIKDSEHFCSKCGQRAIDLNLEYLKGKQEKIQSKMDNADFNNSLHSDSKSDSIANKKSQGHGDIASIAVFILAVVIILFCFGLIMANSNHNDGNNSPVTEVAEVANHYNISLEEGTYLYGEGNSSLIYSNYSTIERYENFTVSGYECYRVDLNDGNWYEISIFRVDYNNIASENSYSSDVDGDGNAYIFFNPKGEYYGYFINIQDSSNYSKYQSLEFLESIFY